MCLIPEFEVSIGIKSLGSFPWLIFMVWFSCYFPLRMLCNCNNLLVEIRNTFMGELDKLFGGGGGGGGVLRSLVHALDHFNRTGFIFRV